MNNTIGAVKVDCLFIWNVESMKQAVSVLQSVRLTLPFICSLTYFIPCHVFSFTHWCFLNSTGSRKMRSQKDPCKPCRLPQGHWISRFMIGRMFFWISLHPECDVPTHTILLHFNLFFCFYSYFFFYIILLIYSSLKREVDSKVRTRRVYVLI